MPVGANDFPLVPVRAVELHARTWLSTAVDDHGEPILSVGIQAQASLAVRTVMSEVEKLPDNWLAESLGHRRDSLASFSCDEKRLLKARK